MSAGESIRGARDDRPFKLVSEFEPSGDQPKAIAALSRGVNEGQSKKSFHWSARVATRRRASSWPRHRASRSWPNVVWSWSGASKR